MVLVCLLVLIISLYPPSLMDVVTLYFLYYTDVTRTEFSLYATH
jgi:hypothetical protein